MVHDVLGASVAVFQELYAAAQVATVIITPSPARKVEVVGVYVSSDNAAGIVRVDIEGEAQPVFLMHLAQRAINTGDAIGQEGGTDQRVTVTCPADTFISIAYHLVV